MPISRSTKVTLFHLTPNVPIALIGKRTYLSVIKWDIVQCRLVQ